MYQDVVNGLVNAVSGVPELRVVLDYEPAALHEAPAVYFTLDSFTRKVMGSITVMTYVVNCNLCILWQDNQEAERELQHLINSLPAALEQDMTLGGSLASGISQVSGGEAIYREIGGVVYRSLTIKVQVTDKAPTGSGI